jgi:DNA polymerase III sliding clamp (beta) subunit (PCNA family)
MDFICSKSQLATAIGSVSRAVSARTTVPMLEGVYICLDGGRAVLYCTDNEIAIEYTVDADVRSPGSAIVNAKLFGDIVRSLPSDEVRVSAAHDGGRITLSSGKSVFDMLVIEADAFPAFPAISERSPYRIDQHVLRRMMSQTAFAVSADETRKTLTGLFLESDGSEIRACAVDGFRIALRRQPVMPRGWQAGAQGGAQGGARKAGEGGWREIGGGQAGGADSAGGDADAGAEGVAGAGAGADGADYGAGGAGANAGVGVASVGDGAGGAGKGIGAGNDGEGSGGAAAGAGYGSGGAEAEAGNTGAVNTGADAAGAVAGMAAEGSAQAAPEIESAGEDEPADADAAAERLSLIVPARTVSELIRIIPPESGELALYGDRNQAIVAFGRCRVFTRIIDGEFFNYKYIIPDEYVTQVNVSRDELLGALESAAVIIAHEQIKRRPVVFSIAGDSVRVRAMGDIGVADVSVPADIQGEDMEVGFNPHFFMDALKAIEDETIAIRFTTKVGQCVIRPLNNDSYTYLILPVKIADPT